mgnify:CR=1 FL=1
MPRILGLAIAVIGLVLLIMGISQMNSFASDVSKFFTNSPTDKSVWLTIVGLAAIVIGGGLAARGGKALA